MALNNIGFGLSAAPGATACYAKDVAAGSYVGGTLTPQVLNAAGTVVLEQGWTGGVATACVVEVVVSGAPTGTSPTLDVQLQDSFDGTNWNKVASVTGSPINAAGTSVLRLDMRATPTADNLRLVAIVGGTTPVFNVGVRIYLARR